ncbi:MAG: YkoP family protein [Anaerolineae bacterium]
MPAILQHMGRGLMRGLDALLRRCLGVFEFTEEPGCVLRLSWLRCPTERALGNGTSLQPGDGLANIHLWNERLPVMPSDGADLRWARQALKSFSYSLRLLHDFLPSHPIGQQTRAVYGEIGFATQQDLDTAVPMLARLGFEPDPTESPPGIWSRFVRFWESLYAYLLIWTYNPASLQHKRRQDLRRCRLWMSLDTLRSRYG